MVPVPQPTLLLYASLMRFPPSFYTVQRSGQPPPALNIRGCVPVQVGYPLAGPKRAIVSAWLGSSTAAAPYVQTTLRPGGDNSPFFVVDAVSGQEVFAGTARVFGDGVIHEYFKQVSYHLDFSGLNTPVSYWAVLFCAVLC